MKITKAVIPAAGWGTRMLPATKAIPKEMLTIVDRPSIQYIVEEAVNSGIEDILIIISRGKTAVEDHFDRLPELEQLLLKTGKEKEYEEIKRISDLANITFIRQKEAKGLGHAVLCAKNFVGDKPFAVLYGDDVIRAEYPVCKQLCDAYEEFGLGTVGIKEVSKEDVQKYCSLKTKPIRDNLFEVSDMVEKPSPEQIFSLYAILGRCVLPPEIFGILEHTKPGAKNELQLTDAMKQLAKEKGMIGVDFVGKRYDMGNKLGVLQAVVEHGLLHPEVGEDFHKYLKQLSKSL